MAINLEFIDNIVIPILPTNIIYINSSYLQSFNDIENNNAENIYILCNSNIVLDKNKTFYFNNKQDLMFLFKLSIQKFIDLCKFLDLIEYEIKDNNFSKQFISYVMKNKIKLLNIHIFMRNEIISINNYINKEDTNIQIKNCTSLFYSLYLKKHKEEVIKYNRHDIYNIIDNKQDYYEFVYKYDNYLTHQIRQTDEYKQYTTKIGYLMFNNYDFNTIKKYIDIGANVNVRHTYCYTMLHYATQSNNLPLVEYLVNSGANLNIRDHNGHTALHAACFSFRYYNEKYLIGWLIDNNGDNIDNINIIKCLVSNGIDINIKDINGYTALHHLINLNNSFETIKYLVNNGANINIQIYNGNTILHSLVEIINSRDALPKHTTILYYLIDNGADVNILNRLHQTAINMIKDEVKRNEIINYIQSKNNIV